MMGRPAFDAAVRGVRFHVALAIVVSIAAGPTLANEPPPLPQLGSPFGVALPGDACNPGIVFGDLVIPSGAAHLPCPDVCEITAKTLMMEKGSGVRVPASCATFELTADSAVFAGGNVIFGATRKVDFSPPSANPGPTISISVGLAQLDFDPVAEAVSEEWMSRFAFGAYMSHGTAGLPAPANDLAGLAVVSIGEAGRGGPTGAKGHPAGRKGCNGESGDPAGNGGVGGTGGKGGAGGAINLDIKVAAASRNTITGYDVQLISLGGVGGAGGQGGQGGDGAAGRCCAEVFGNCTYRRSGFSPGLPGPPGAIGPQGVPGPVSANIRLQ